MRITLLLLVAAIAWAQAPPPPDPVVITIGNEKVTKSQFEQIVASLPDQQRAAVASPQGRKALAEQLAELKSMAAEARLRKLDQSAAVKTRIALQTDQALATVLYQELTETAKSDDATLHAYYDAHKNDWEELKARHILIRFTGSQVPLRPNEKDLSDSEALAKTKDIRAKLVAGGDFAAVAKAESDDTGSGANGGDLGSFTKGRMVPQFEQAAFALKVGDISEPVKTQFGYHLIQVQSHESKSFDDVKAEIETKVKPELAQKGVEDVKKKTPIVFNDEYFGK
jgi:peptidyl-prolyl cis-trans isomerase C